MDQLRKRKAARQRLLSDLDSPLAIAKRDNGILYARPMKRRERFEISQYLGTTKHTAMLFRFLIQKTHYFKSLKSGDFCCHNRNSPGTQKNYLWHILPPL